MLDYETTKNFMITVLVRDMPTSGSSKETRVNITIIVSDINDNAPVFVNLPSGPIIVPETLPQYSVIYQFNATDDDSGMHGSITFKMIEANCSNINIHSNGSLYVNGLYLNVCF